MKSIIKYLLIPVMWLVSADHPAAQTAAEKLNYLIGNIRIFVLHQPNTDTPSYYNVKTTGIHLDTDTIILGKKHNNGLGKSALLLSALFKDANGKQFGGNQSFQNHVYLLLHALGKPVDIYFINDVVEPFDMKYSANYGFYVLQYQNNAAIYDAVYKAEDNSLAGQIIVSGKGVEQSDLSADEGYLMYAFAKLLTGDYTYLDPVQIVPINNKNPPPNMYKQDPIYTTVSPDDTRNAVTDAIAFAFRLQIDGNKNALRTSFFNWLSNGPFFIVRQDLIPGLVSNGFDIPENMTLNYKIRQSFKEMMDTGRIPTDPPYQEKEEIRKHFKIYGLNFLPDNLLIRNKIVFAAYCDLFMKEKGEDVLINSLRLQNGKLQKATPDNQLPVFIENLCQSILGDQNFAEAVSEKKFSIAALYPLALLDVFMEFPTRNSSTTELSDYDETFHGIFPPNSFSKVLLEEYFRIRPKIYEEVQKVNKKEGIGYLASGYENLVAMANAILDYMVLNG